MLKPQKSHKKNWNVDYLSVFLSLFPQYIYYWFNAFLWKQTKLLLKHDNITKIFINQQIVDKPTTFDKQKNFMYAFTF